MVLCFFVKPVFLHLYPPSIHPSPAAVFFLSTAKKFTMERRFKKGLEDDLILLEEISESAIVDTLHRRFQDATIYTYIGEVLLSVNPFRPIQIYSKDTMHKYASRFSYELRPHIFATAEAAYKSSRRGDNQCILITGESGSGKTEASKKVMEYIAEIADGGGDTANKIKEIILQSNPLLEAFGNAKTVRNNNSSRFGKYMEILFDPSGAPASGRVTNFLLEKPRVVGQSDEERSFHIFYQVLGRYCETGALPPQGYHYLNQTTCYAVKGIDDAADFEDVLEALTTVGYDKAQVNDIILTVIGILWLGNIDFKENGALETTEGTQVAVKEAAEFFGITREALIQGLTERTFVAGTNAGVQSKMNRDQCLYTRDALAKATYSKLFQSLIDQLNKTLASHGAIPSDAKTIGILDIYGFEIFERNSFEQFCINYVNEKLQQLFIELTLRKEQAEYVSEGIEWEAVDYFNNKIVCDMIEVRKNGDVGLFALIDDASAQQHNTDDQLLANMGSAFHDHAHFCKGTKGRSKTDFTILHYAGEVSYTITGFLDKNRDTLYPSLVKMMSESTRQLIRDIYPKPKSSRKKPPTAGTQFKKQVKRLMDTLATCAPHYVRCIKPNDDKKGGLFVKPRVAHQVKYLGLLENVRVRRAGFAHREPYSQFYKRYKMICPKTWPSFRAKGGMQEASRHILDAVGVSPHPYNEGGIIGWGKTQIFMKKPQTLFALEGARERKLPAMAAIIQERYRRYVHEKRLREMREKAREIFGGLKCRCRSLDFIFTADYLNIRGADVVMNALTSKTFSDKKILFDSLMMKYNFKLKAQERVLLLSENAIYNMKPPIVKRCKVQRRIPITDIERISLSSLGDNFLAIHVLVSHAATTSSCSVATILPPPFFMY